MTADNHRWLGWAGNSSDPVLYRVGGAVRVSGRGSGWLVPVGGGGCGEQGEAEFGGLVEDGAAGPVAVQPAVRGGAGLAAWRNLQSPVRHWRRQALWVRAIGISADTYFYDAPGNGGHTRRICIGILGCGVMVLNSPVIMPKGFLAFQHAIRPLAADH